MTATNVGLSVAAKLLNLQKTTGRPHQYLIDRFAQERFLYRLSTGIHRDRFMLKGGLLLTALSGQFYRATRDIDMRVFAENDTHVIRKLVIEAIAHEVENDGMIFDVGGITIEDIMAHGDDERGLRLGIRGLLGEKVRSHVQLDMGFGDRVLLPQQAFEYPVLLADFPAPTLRAYSIESAIAEKLEAIAVLDRLNSRYKDYDDVLVYAASQPMHIAPLSHAVAVTFETRGTAIERLLPALGADRATSARERAFQSYRKKLAVDAETASFATLLARLRAFVRPLIDYVEDGMPRIWGNGTWTPT